MALVLTETPRSNSTMIPGVKETHEEEEEEKKADGEEGFYKPITTKQNTELEFPQRCRWCQRLTRLKTTTTTTTCKFSNEKQKVQGISRKLLLPGG